MYLLCTPSTKIFDSDRVTLDYNILDIVFCNNCHFISDISFREILGSVGYASDHRIIPS